MTASGAAAPALGAGTPLPGRFRGLARAITGRAELPRFTTGTTTRRWLRAAGARAAATGTTMHLPGHPGTGPSQIGAVAHELTHLAHRGGRPRFLLNRLPTVPDAEERLAQQVGEAARRLASRPAGRAVDLPGTAGDLTGRAGLTGAGGDLARRIEDRTPQMPAAARAAGPLSAARAAGPLSAAGAADLPATPVPAGPGPLPVPYPTLPVAGETPRAATGSAGERVTPTSLSLPAPPARAAEHTAGLRNPGHDAGRTLAGPTAAETGAAAAAGHPPAATDPAFDDLLDALEDRLLAELERRGGRYAGVF
jgi:hypothetical protein